MSDVKHKIVVVNGITFDVTTTTIYDPEAVEEAKRFMVREIARAIIARRMKMGGEPLAGAVSEPEVRALAR